jgi:hypothetical protein
VLRVVAERTALFAERIEPFAWFPRLITQEVRGLSQAGRVMADRAGLGFVGFIFGGVTAAVMLVAVTVVIGHAEGRLALDSPPAHSVSSH